MMPDGEQTLLYTIIQPSFANNDLYQQQIHNRFGKVVNGTTLISSHFKLCYLSSGSLVLISELLLAMHSILKKSVNAGDRQTFVIQCFKGSLFELSCSSS